ncbi:Uridine nucleosidase 1 [Camellia lanceoleosa]|uniref:Uridine nucleosidase 1 n=1 Tax=Camellia lanceoleosa TaxID=1840588 RepID=A0ACC0IHS6_9ERIC|nr:Uridine nucleosidase 1 [Camellia lanceoleosa]
MCLPSRITGFFPPWLFWHHGQEGMKLICGTRIAGMNHKKKKGRQVYLGAYDDEEAAAQRQTASLLIANLGESVIGASLQEKEGFRWLTSDSDGPIRAGQGGRPRAADFVGGSDGLGNISLPPPKSKKIEKTASEFLVDMVSKYPGEAMKRDSSFASKVKRVVILGGSFFALGNVNPAPEANSLGVEAYTSWQGLNLKLCYNKARRRRVQVTLDSGLLQ